MDTPTWQNTLNTSNSSYFDMENTATRAHDIGYDFMCWNDRIYKVFFEHPTVSCVDTGLTIEDLATVSIPKRHIVVAGREQGDEPLLEVYMVAYTTQQQFDGEHYEKAVAMAKADGMQPPFICYDEQEYDSIKRVAERLNNSK